MRRKIEESLDEDLEKNIDLNPSQSSLNMELLDAAMSPFGEEESVERIFNALSKGADLNATFGPDGPNALYFAAVNNKEELVDWLLTASQKGQSIKADYIMDNGSSFLNSLVSELAPAHLIKKIVEHFKLNVNEKDKQGYTPLFKAIIQNNSKNVNLFLELGADPNILYSKNKISPLLFASAECFSDIVIPLVKAGADIDFVDADGHNALMYSLLRPSRALPKIKKDSLKEFINYLLQNTNINVNPQTSSGASPLVFSILADDSNDILTQLIDKGADLNKAFDMGHRSRGEETALHFAAKRGDWEKFVILVKAGADISKPDGFGVTSESYFLLNEEIRHAFIPLIMEGEIKIDVNCIVADRDFKNQFDAKALKKNTVFSMLLVEMLTEATDPEEENAKKSATFMVNYMLNNGVNLTLKDIPELHSSEPLFIAMDFANKELFDLLVNSKKLDLNKKFNMGNEYVEEGHNYFSHLFSDKGAKNLAIIQSEYRSAVKEAKNETFGKKKNKNLTEDEKEVKEKEFEEKKKKIDHFINLKKEALFATKVSMFDTLIKNGADINAPISNDGKSAIFSITNMDWLVKLNSRGIDILPKDNSGFNPLDYAILNNRKNVIDTYRDMFSIPENSLFKLAFHEFEKVGVKDSETFIPRLGVIKALFSDDVYKEYNKKSDSYVFPGVPKQVNYQDESGNSPLLVAAANGVEFLADLYISLGANVNQVNENNETALQYACANNMPGLAKRLIESGARVDIVNAEGFTALNFAENNGMKEQLDVMSSILNGEISFSSDERKGPKI